ncbi:MAG TPA: NUDIX hydrolase [Candidatus Binatia bacterium]|nr:NUDIX hydrolase [Candidatus Binatia bacterium]
MAEKDKKNPVPTVDILIEIDGGIVLIERKNPPHGWAIPGGFVDYGESLETAAVREAKEEISLDVELVEQFHSYSDPKRDARGHTISTVFIATAKGIPNGADDAKTAAIFREGDLPSPIVFDHPQILKDYFRYKKTGQRPKYTKR